ncbi:MULTISPECIES: coiled-coil domain-containing protein [Vibrio]|uniref:hypothetical protein n=1 Tax=Vibrio TaxID=662 RepID=UPI0018692700|nr:MULTISPECIES: hypothetical protein [Vibrio]
MMTKKKMDFNEMESETKVMQFAERTKPEENENENSEANKEQYEREDVQQHRDDEDNESVITDETESNDVNNESLSSTSTNEPQEEQQRELSRSEQRAIVREKKRREQNEAKQARLNERQQKINERRETKQAKKEAKRLEREARKNDRGVVQVFAIETSKILLTSSIAIGVSFVGYEFLESKSEELQIEQRGKQQASIASLTNKVSDMQGKLENQTIQLQEFNNQLKNEQMTFKTKLEDLTLMVEQFIKNSNANDDLIKKMQSDVASNKSLTTSEISSIRRQLAALEKESMKQSEELLTQVKSTVAQAKREKVAIKPVPRSTPIKSKVQTVTALDGLELETVTQFGSNNVAVFSNRGLGAIQRLEGERIGSYIIQKISSSNVTVKGIADNETYIIKSKG